jgi:hypothetical protein
MHTQLQQGSYLFSAWQNSIPMQHQLSHTGPKKCDPKGISLNSFCPGTSELNSYVYLNPNYILSTSECNLQVLLKEYI